MKLKWITMVISLALAACGSAATPASMPDARATALMQQIIATATALRLTSEAGEQVAATPPLPDAIQLSVAPAQSLGGADFQVSGPFTISASAVNIVRVEFYTQPSDQTAAPTLEFTDDEGNDGWNWTWQSPPAGWFGQVWVIAYYADDSSTSSELFITVAP
ncbi:MAG: hypothetical protein ACT4QE_08685 [Anaerolineales bacterium]